MKMKEFPEIDFPDLPPGYMWVSFSKEPAVTGTKHTNYIGWITENTESGWYISPDASRLGDSMYFPDITMQEAVDLLFAQMLVQGSFREVET